uniref:Uncharacterized protein n=1 Tax=Clytia hemisphaerica TaxID=252671 RepID=A0A7M5XGV6_9CNID
MSWYSYCPKLAKSAVVSNPSQCTFNRTSPYSFQYGSTLPTIQTVDTTPLGIEPGAIGMFGGFSDNVIKLLKSSWSKGQWSGSKLWSTLNEVSIDVKGFEVGHVFGRHW